MLYANVHSGVHNVNGSSETRPAVFGKGKDDGALSMVRSSQHGRTMAVKVEELMTANVRQSPYEWSFSGNFMFDDVEVDTNGYELGGRGCRNDSSQHKRWL